MAGGCAFAPSLSIRYRTPPPHPRAARSEPGGRWGGGDSSSRLENQACLEAGVVRKAERTTRQVLGRACVAELAPADGGKEKSVPPA